MNNLRQALVDTFNKHHGEDLGLYLLEEEEPSLYDEYTYVFSATEAEEETPYE